MVFALWILLSGFGVGVTLHRLLAHKSFKTSLAMKDMLSFVACLCVQGSPIFWVNVHRGYHHKFADQQADIHSPIHGKWWSYMLWTIFVKPESLSYKSVTDLARDKWQIFLNKYYFHIIWAIWIWAYIYGTDILFTLVIAQLITMHLEFCVNLFCHTKLPFSYRNFDTKDNSVNYWLFGILCWGIGFHNNHHAKPNSYDFGSKPREIDFTKYLVRMVKTDV